MIALIIVAAFSIGALTWPTIKSFSTKIYNQELEYRRKAAEFDRWKALAEASGGQLLIGTKEKTVSVDEYADQVISIVK